MLSVIWGTLSINTGASVAPATDTCQCLPQTLANGDLRFSSPNTGSKQHPQMSKDKRFGLLLMMKNVLEVGSQANVFLFTQLLS